MKTQEQLLQEIIDLKKQRPDLDIKICVASDDVLEGGWTYHKILSVRVESWFETYERIYIDKSEILEYFEEQVFDEYPNFSDKRIKGLAKMRYLEQVKEAICVYTHA